jgi:N-methylhydantoinase A
MASLVIGLDIGGTFTDLALLHAEGEDVLAVKVPTTPRDPWAGARAGLQAAAVARGLGLPELLSRTVKLVHGTTLTSNVLFNRDGARVGLIATRGFGDQILIMRAKGRVAGLSLSERRHFRATRKPEPIVDRPFIQEVAERIDHKGAVVTPLDLVEAEAAVECLVARGVEAIAVCLLWSFKNPGHERLLGDLIRSRHPEIFVSLSSELSPVVGEYERTATTALNCYVGPAIAGYLARLRAETQGAGLPAPPLILQSHGGAVHPDEVVPIQTVESGPAAGVLGAKFLADLLGVPNVIATDMGGTTFKVGLIRDGAWFAAPEAVIGQFEIQVPMVDVISIGAGGGSIAANDGGRLRVGPQSAGAEPGPACYGKGGELPTVTDADLALGYLNPSFFLGGDIRLDPARAVAAVRRHIAEPLFGGDVAAAALGIRRVADAQMADLIRKATIERGYDPREFVLMAYGGAGPAHCCAFAEEAGLDRAVVPFAATVYSALGAAVAEVRMSRKRSAPRYLPADPAAVAEVYGGLEAEVAAAMGRQGIPPTAVSFTRWVEMRYRRQMHVIRVPVPAGALDGAAVERVAAGFEALYARLYGASAAYREAGMEMITYGVEAAAKTHQPELPAPPPAGPDPMTARVGSRRVCWDARRGPEETPVYRGEDLRPGHAFRGPAIGEYRGTTLVVPAGWAAELDRYRNVHLTRSLQADKLTS